MRRAPADLLRSRYLVLSAVLVVLMASQTLNQQWSTDVWLHSATVRELARHPLDPGHPFLALDVANPYISPYTLAVGLLSRLVSIGPVGALSIAAMGNLVLFLAAFRRFVLLLVDDVRAPFNALVFTLILWGPRPWRWSGFLNLNSIGFGLPYPSMFAAAMALFAMSAVILVVRDLRLTYLPALGACAFLVVISHPNTGVSMAVGCAALAVAFVGPRPGRVLAGLVACGLLVVVAIALWPYYSFFELLSDSAFDASDSASSNLYAAVLQRTFPALVALPVVLWRLRANRRDPLGVMLVAFLAVYLYGGVTGNQTYGRTLSFVMVVLHVALSGAAVVWEDRMRSRPAPALRWAGAGMAGLLVLGLASTSPGILRTVPTSLLPGSLRSDDRLDRVGDRYAFLDRHSGQDDIVLTDLNLNSMVTPTFGGKVVATDYNFAFVPDNGERRADVERFYRTTTGLDDRRSVLQRYGVSFILIDEEAVPGFSQDSGGLDALGRVAYRDDRFVLLAVSMPGNPTP